MIIDQGTYSEVDASRAMKQVLMSVRYLHSQGIVHRDLKLQNLLLTEKDTKKADLKVADFGLSAVLTGQYSPSEPDAVKSYNKLRDRWGTPHYFAPEMVRARDASEPEPLCACRLEHRLALPLRARLYSPLLFTPCRCRRRTGRRWTFGRWASSCSSCWWAGYPSTARATRSSSSRS